MSPIVPNLEIANVLAAAAIVASRIRSSDARFICAATASSGFGAVLARKPYGYWVGTSLSDEGASRRAHLGRSRRAARAASDPGLRLLERTTLRQAEVRWATSPASRRAVAEAAGVPESTIRVVPIPIDPVKFAPADDTEWERALETPELVFVGRADDPRKNLRLLLDGFSILRPRLGGARLTLIGTPPEGPLPDGRHRGREASFDRGRTSSCEPVRAPLPSGGVRDRRRRGARLGGSGTRDTVRRAGGSCPRISGRRGAHGLSAGRTGGACIVSADRPRPASRDATLRPRTTSFESTIRFDLQSALAEALEVLDESG